MPASIYPRKPLFPMFLRLEARRCVVAGAGAVATGKILGLLAAGARVLVIAPAATPRVAALVRAGKLAWHRRKFRAADLSGSFLVVAATSSPAVHERIWRAARRRNVLCNVVDDPARCDFFYPAIVRRGSLQIAISTGGRSPALAHQLRKSLARQFGSEFAGWLAHLGRVRSRLQLRELNIARRRRLAHRAVRHGLAAHFTSTNARHKVVPTR